MEKQSHIFRSFAGAVFLLSVLVLLAAFWLQVPYSAAMLTSMLVICAYVGCGGDAKPLGACIQSMLRKYSAKEEEEKEVKPRRRRIRICRLLANKP